MAEKKEKQYVSDNAQLMAEWDWEKNTEMGIDPNRITYGSTKKVNWLCNAGHSYTARVDHRTIMKSSCPYCAHKVPILGETDLATTHPELLLEWDYEHNEQPPEHFLPGSNKKVGWICPQCDCHWETQIIARTMKNTGCPICKRVQRGKTRKQRTIERRGSLAKELPELTAEWDYEKNGNVIPSNVHASSKEIVWWKTACGHSWQASIQNRVSGNGCPVCAGKIVLVGFNDLSSQYPEISCQWHPDLNNGLLPNQVTAHSDHKVWWLCPECAEAYYTSIYSRTSLHTNCPICANKTIIAGKNDLVTTHPNIAAEWNYAKNIDLNPYDVVAGSNRRVWWICEKGHEWEASVNDRKSGRGCPVCRGEHKTSLPEQILFYYLAKATKATNRYNFAGREIDIYLGDLNIGIEYNGSFYHQNRMQQDIDKREFLHKHGVRIIVVHEGKEEYVEGDDIYYSYVNQEYLNLTKVIKTIFKLCGLPNCDIDIKRDRPRIYEQFLLQEKSNSFAAKYPWLINEWDYERNGKLTPWQISYGSSKKIHWICNTCGNRWEAVANSRKKNGCPSCKKGVQVITGVNDLAKIYPVLAEEWNYFRNDKKPTEIAASSRRSMWWMCKLGHEWKAKIEDRVKNADCPICAREKRVFAEK